jgi:hypothetical protein
MLYFTELGEVCCGCRTALRQRKAIEFASQRRGRASAGTADATDPEADLQRENGAGVSKAELAMAWLFLYAAAAWGVVAALPPSIRGWWTLKTVCAWCKPQRRLSGNPFAGRVSHGVCKHCLEKQFAEIGRRKRCYEISRETGAGARPFLPSRSAAASEKYDVQADLRGETASVERGTF